MKSHKQGGSSSTKTSSDVISAGKVLDLQCSAAAILRACSLGEDHQHINSTNSSCQCQHTPVHLSGTWGSWGGGTLTDS